MNKSFLALLLALWSIAASAQVITFDDIINAHDSSISNGYAGLNWDNFLVEDTATNPVAGYPNGVVSGSNVAFNGYGGLAVISAGSVFTFNSAYFTAAWNDGLAISVFGYNGATLVGSTSFLVNTNGPVLETFNWSGIDRITFGSSGGTENPNYQNIGMGTQFAMDNMTISPVPEPQSYVMLLAGLGLIVITTLRNKQNLEA